MKKNRLRLKIFTGFSLILLLLIIVLGLGAYNILNLSKASQRVLRENYNSIVAAEHMIDAIERQDSGILLFIGGKKEKGKKQFSDFQLIFLEWLTRAKDNITINGEKEIINNLERYYQLYVDEFDNLKKNESGIDQYEKNILPIFTNIRKTCIDLSEINHNFMLKANEETSRLGKISYYSLIVIGIFIIIAGLFFSIVISNIIVTPVINLLKGIQDVSSGNLEVNIPVTSKDEIGTLTKRFNQMVRRLKSYNDLNLQKIFLEKNKNRGIINNIEDGILVFDNQMFLTNFNKKAAELYNISNENSDNIHLMEIFSEKKLIQSIKNALKKNETPKDHLECIIKIIKGNTELHYEAILSIIKDNNGKISDIIILLKDITKYKEVERMKNNFILTASHELKTPITSIILSINLLLEKFKENTKYLELLNIIRDESQRLENIVKDLLDLARFESGENKITLSEISPDNLLDTLEDHLKNKLSEKNITLKKEIDINIEKITADFEKLLLVLENLITNSIKYSPENSEIIMEIHKKRNFIFFYVKDMGKGISDDFKTKIFEKFFRIENDENVEGTGLGLSICKELINEHGGTIWVEDNEDKGSIFIFTLPI